MGRSSLSCLKLLRPSLTRYPMSPLPRLTRTPAHRPPALLVLPSSEPSITTRLAILTYLLNPRGRISTDRTPAALVKATRANSPASPPELPVLAFHPLLPQVTNLFLIRHPSLQSMMFLVSNTTLTPLILQLLINRPLPFLLLPIPLRLSLPLSQPCR
jgi:hypothetical protein